MDESKSAWTKVALITGFVTAITGLLVILDKVGWIGHPDSDSPPGVQRQQQQQLGGGGPNPTPQPTVEPTPVPVQNDRSKNLARYCCNEDDQHVCILNEPLPPVGTVCTCFYYGTPYFEGEACR
jgi:hypothetical protein